MTLMSVRLGFAASPSSIDISYDSKEKNLHIAVNHVTHDPREHYIRKILIYKNADTEPAIYRYVQQSSTQAQAEDVAIDLKPGDTIKVEAYCIEAGKAENTFTVPEDLPPEKK